MCLWQRVKCSSQSVGLRYLQTPWRPIWLTGSRLMRWETLTWRCHIHAHALIGSFSLKLSHRKWLGADRTLKSLYEGIIVMCHWSICFNDLKTISYPTIDGISVYAPAGISHSGAACLYNQLTCFVITTCNHPFVIRCYQFPYTN